MDYRLRARLRKTTPDEGGNDRPVISGYRPDWNLGQHEAFSPTLGGGAVRLLSAESIAPGESAEIEIVPWFVEGWWNVRVGTVLPMHEGARVLGHATVLAIEGDPLLTLKVLRFATQARRFCDFIEEAAGMYLPARLRAARQRLSALYDAGLGLPRAPPTTAEGSPRSALGSDGWPGFGEHDLYWEVFDPYVDEDPTAGDLSDDFLDLLHDLQAGLAAWDANPARPADAIFEWRTSFETHWGNHAASALRALHRACSVVE